MAPGGYAWWYVDALSDDGRHGLTIIAFVGSVFSPWYAWARQRGRADPLDHVAINVALYGGRQARWAMTERGSPSLERSADRLRIGPSSLEAAPGCLSLAIEEWAAPVPRRLSGRVEIETGPVFHARHALDASGRHVWRPVAPFARVRVAFREPALDWHGSAYVDMNRGDEPLEDAFRFWTWSRAAAAVRTTVFYDVERRDGSRCELALDLMRDGSHRPAEAPGHAALPGTLWRVRRALRSQARPSAVRTFEDTPFYTRTACVSTLHGHAHDTVCESVDLDRFAAPWVRALLPFRMPRRR